MSDHPGTPAYAFDPELAELAAMSVHPPPTDAAAARELMAMMMGAMPQELDPADVELDDRVIAGPPGDPDVTVRVYTPRNRTGDALPAVLYVHGGAFALGSIDTEHAGALRLAREVGAVIVSVEYRLAPEHPYPAAVDDCDAAFRWIAASASQLGIDPDRIGVIGASSGGTLAAATALLARDRGGPPLAFQCLVYPTLDDRMETTSVGFVGTPLIDGSDVARCWDYYLGADRGDVPAYAAPGRATDLHGLPPTYIMTAELDPLRDDGLRYASRLLDAGVSVELHNYAGAFHGFDLFPTAVSSRALDEQVAWVVAVTTTS
jgi:acetyl esterase/lipase